MKVIWAKKQDSDSAKEAAGLSPDTVDGIRNYFQMLDCIDSQAVRPAAPAAAAAAANRKDPNEYPQRPVLSSHDAEFSSLPSNFVVNQATSATSQDVVSATDCSAPPTSCVSQDTADSIKKYFQMLGSIDVQAVKLPPAVVTNLSKGANWKANSENDAKVGSLSYQTTKTDIQSAKHAVLPPIVEEDSHARQPSPDKASVSGHSTTKRVCVVPNLMVAVGEHTINVSQSKYQIEVLKHKMSTVDTVQGGRYTLVDRNFTPLTQNTSNSCQTNVVTTVSKAVVNESNSGQQKQQQLQSNDEVDCPKGEDSPSDDESTDTLLEEAKQYVELAKSKLVTPEDWKVIECNSRKKKVSGHDDETKIKS